MITAADLHLIMPAANIEQWATPLLDAMAAGALTSLNRAAMFLAQIAHESSELRVLGNAYWQVSPNWRKH